MKNDGENVRVFVRVRPSGRSVNNSVRCVETCPDGRSIRVDAKPEPRVFTYDSVAGEASTQEEIFQAVGKPITLACLEGYNGTIFAYGQTGSGKTYTMLGPAEETKNLTPAAFHQRGLIPRVLEFLFSRMQHSERSGGGDIEFLSKCSFLEIYNERVHDLLDTAASASAAFSSSGDKVERSGLQMREDIRHGVTVEGLQEETVTSAEEALAVMRKGARNRRIGETAMNRESSRSHSVFTITIEAKEAERNDAGEVSVTKSRVARFNLVDLAGSERQRDTKAAGDRLREAGNINRSLSSLGQVINALVERAAGKSRHVHYRDSKLTFLLKASLGGNARTYIISNVTPDSNCFGETLSTLKFAARAKQIKNVAIKNEDTSGTVDALRKEIRRLHAQLSAPTAAAAAQAPSPPGGAAVASSTPQSAAMLMREEKLLQQALERCESAELRTLKAAGESDGHKRAIERLQTAVLELRFHTKLQRERIYRFKSSLAEEGIESAQLKLVQDLQTEAEDLRGKIATHCRPIEAPADHPAWNLLLPDECRGAEEQPEWTEADAETHMTADVEEDDVALDLDLGLVGDGDAGAGNDAPRRLNLIAAWRALSAKTLTLIEDKQSLQSKVERLQDTNTAAIGTPGRGTASVALEKWKEEQAFQESLVAATMRAEVAEAKAREAEKSAADAEDALSAAQKAHRSEMKMERSLVDSFKRSLAEVETSNKALMALKSAENQQAANETALQLEAKIAAAMKDNTSLLCSLEEERAKGVEATVEIDRSKLCAQGFADDVQRLQGELAALDERHRGAEERSSQLALAAAKAEAELAQSREETASAAQENQGLHAEAEETQLQLQTARRELAQKTNEAERAQFTLEGVQEDLDTELEQGKFLQAQLEDAQRGLETAENACEQFQSRLDASESQHGEDRDTLASNLEALTLALEEKTRSLEASQGAEEALNARLSEAENDAQGQREAVLELTERLASHESSAISKDSRIEQLESEVAAVKSKADELESALETTSAVERELKSELKSTEEEFLAELEQQRRTAQQSLADAKQLSDAQEEQIREITAKLASAESVAGEYAAAAAEELSKAKSAAAEQNAVCQELRDSLAGKTAAFEKLELENRTNQDASATQLSTMSQENASLQFTCDDQKQQLGKLQQDLKEEQDRTNSLRSKLSCIFDSTVVANEQITAAECPAPSSTALGHATLNRPVAAAQRRPRTGSRGASSWAGGTTEPIEPIESLPTLLCSKDDDGGSHARRRRSGDGSRRDSLGWLEETIRMGRDEVAKAREEAEKARSELTESKHALVALRARQASTEDRLAASDAEVELQAKQLAEEKDRVGVLMESITSMESSRHERMAEIESQNAQLAVAAAKLASAEGDADEQSGEASKLKLELEETRRATEEAAARALEAKAAADALSSSSEQAVSDANAARVAAETELADRKAEIDSAQRETALWKEEKAKWNRDMIHLKLLEAEAYKQVEEAEEVRNRKEEECAAMRQQLDEARAEAEALTEKNTSLIGHNNHKQKISALRTLKGSLATSQEQVKAQTKTINHLREKLRAGGLDVGDEEPPADQDEENKENEENEVPPPRSVPSSVSTCGVKVIAGAGSELSAALAKRRNII